MMAAGAYAHGTRLSHFIDSVRVLEIHKIDCQMLEIVSISRTIYNFLIM